jgi:tetratricopeptide (TPR) repeat protein
MENLKDLQDQARNFERAGQHAAALELYGRILQEPAGDRDGNMWARAGNVRVALGREAEAAESYAVAIDRYAAAGLDNLALSFCQRLLRLDSDRPEILLRFGQLSAARGYVRDSRHGYVEYAEHAAGAGNTAAAVAALRDYLLRFPTDAAVRGRISELTGEEEPEPTRIPEPAAQAEGPLPGLMPTAEGEAHAVDRPVGEGPDSESPVPPPDRAEAAADSYGVLEGFEPTQAEQGTDAESGTAAHPRWGEAGEEAVSENDEDEEVAEPLPLLGTDSAPTRWQGGEPSPSVDPLEEARRRAAAEPTNIAVRRDLVLLLEARGDAGLEMALIDAERDFADAERPTEALEFVEHLARRRPNDTTLQQRRVERALRAGDRPALIRAYLALAGRFDAELDSARSQESLRRVLEIDPANEDARAALASATAASIPPQDYVDLGELILSGGPEEATRFQVAIGDPTGDEANDFAEILQLFRKKVSESLDPKDATSHYDLGLAFKDMGLYEDAIVHLQSALRGGANPLATLEVLGDCFVHKGQISLASRVFERAIRLDDVADSDLVGVLYGLARCQEELGQIEAAVANFERVIAVDLAFRDAANRLEALSSP